jgi:predicted Zn-dependent protease
MRARLILATLALAASASTVAVAQQPSGAPAPAGGAAPAPAAKPGEPRRDPAGQTGISPYMEQIVKGQAAFVARDVPGAVAAFQEAIKLEPDKMLGFYRLGEAMLESGKPEEAETAWNTALGKKGSEELLAKVMLCMADLRERQKNLQAAKDAWAAYAAFLTGHPKANGYPGTPTERQKQIDRRVKDEQDYAAVKERIKKREAERQKEAEENAKRDKRNQ